MENNIVTIKGVEMGDGDIVGRDKIQHITMVKEEFRQKKIIRNNNGINLSQDSSNTILIDKLKDGNLNQSYIDFAIQNKLDALELFIELLKSEEGKNIITDIYNNLITLVNNITLPLDSGDLLKNKSDEIKNEVEKIKFRYQNIIELDDAMIFGLLFIATSNCAIRWKLK